LNPEHVEALNHMAFIELQRGNKNGAERLRQRAQGISRGKMHLEENELLGMKHGK